MQSGKVMPAQLCTNKTRGVIDFITDTSLNVIDILVYSSVYVSLCAVSLLVVSCVLQEIPCTPAMGIITFLVTFAIYNLNRKTDEAEDAVNHSQRLKFTKKYGKYLYSASFVFYIFGLILASTYGIMVLLMATISLIVGILYSIPFLPEQFRYRRLKEIPTIKNVTLGLVWAITLTLLPVFMTAGSLTGTTYITGIYLYTFFFINTTLFDMRDVGGDRLAGVCTIPVYVGMPITKHVLSVINILLGVIVVWYFVNVNAYFVVFLVVLGMVFTQMLILFFDRYGSNHYFCDVLADGEFILIGIFLFVLGLLVPGLIAVSPLVIG